jgi:hypothetical protein
MQRLQDIKDLNAFVDIVKAIAYNHPDLHKAEELNPPVVSIRKANDTDPTPERTVRTLELSFPMSEPFAIGLKARINSLIDFLANFRKPMYIKVINDGLIDTVSVHVWDDNST